MPISKIGQTRLGQNKNKDPLFPIIFSVIAASVLMVYPLSYTGSGWRPLFMLMVTLFWVLGQPTWCGIWFAFGTGLFADLLLDAPLGMNALSRIMTFANLWVISAIAILAHLALIWVMQVMGGIQFPFARHWQPLLSSILLWPVLYYFLRKWRI